jgi:hypothetical protein
LTIKEKYGTNLWTKLIMPIKDLTSFLEAGAGRFRIAAILSGSILIPELKTICPRIFPLVIPNIDLEGFKEIPNFLHRMRNFIDDQNDPTGSFNKQSSHQDKPG